MSELNKYAVIVIDGNSGKTVNTIECASEISAKKVERGVCINMNHERYYTDVIKLENKRE